ncbi:MAG TPA: hypothetical protein VFU71_22665 [Burkholderiaceae bacterium]|nr:hypothetical protein [Burkholderiaceae bacterium]
MATTTVASVAVKAQVRAAHVKAAQPPRRSHNRGEKRSDEAVVT